jgi:hypothetical protein
MTLPEALGYLASLLIAVAMMMQGLVRLRLTGLLGSLTMAVYGGLIGAGPILGANLFIAAVHAFHLRRLLGSATHFELQPIARTSHWYFDRFLRFHAADIALSHPRFDAAKIPERQGFFILRDMLSAGLFLYADEGESLRIHLDYVTPAFRDLKNARFAYGAFDRQFADGVARRFVVRPDTAEMRAYFLKVGFEPGGGGELVRPIPLGPRAA